MEDLDKDMDRDELPYKDIPNFPVTTGGVYWQPQESVYCSQYGFIDLRGIFILEVLFEFVALSSKIDLKLNISCGQCKL